MAMKRVDKYSRGRAIVMYLGMTALLGATALTTDVALGYLSNMQTYLHIRAVRSVDATAGTGASQPGASAASAIASGADSRQ
jgi:hypothetical protein